MRIQFLKNNVERTTNYRSYRECFQENNFKVHNVTFHNVKDLFFDELD